MSEDILSAATMMQEEEEEQWNVPPVRVWDITTNSTRYEKLVAAPSDHDMRLMWFMWAAIMGVVTVFTMCVFAAVVASPKARRNPFNVYLIFLMIPDMVMSGPCFLTCLFNGINGVFTTVFACKAQSFYFTFGIAANGWLNAVICRQLYLMLGSARRFQRYAPPTHRRVIIDSLVVYLIAGFIASWGLWDKPWWPHKTQLVNGTACVPMDYDLKSSLFFYLVFFPCLMGIPMVYVVYVGYQIYKFKMLPPTGRRRILAINFLRLAAVFLIMWLPAVLFFFVVGPWVSHWVLWSGGAWSHLQGGVSALVSLWKPDIGEAVRDFWKCQLHKQYVLGNVRYSWVTTRFSDMGYFIRSSTASVRRRSASKRDTDVNSSDDVSNKFNMDDFEDVDGSFESGRSSNRDGENFRVGKPSSSSSVLSSHIKKRVLFDLDMDDCSDVESIINYLEEDDDEIVFDNADDTTDHEEGRDSSESSNPTTDDSATGPISISIEEGGMVDDGDSSNAITDVNTTHPVSITVEEGGMVDHGDSSNPIADDNTTKPVPIVVEEDEITDHGDSSNPITDDDSKNSTSVAGDDDEMV